MARRRFAHVLAAAAAALIAIGVAACGRVGDETFVVEHQRPEGPLPVVLADHTGRLLSLAPGEQVEGRERFGITRADGLLPTVEVWWVGRACDERVSVTLDQSRERLRLEVKVDSTDGCGDVPVSRSILLTFAESITAERFDVIVPTRVQGRPPPLVVPVDPPQ